MDKKKIFKKIKNLCLICLVVCDTICVCDISTNIVVLARNKPTTMCTTHKSMYFLLLSLLLIKFHVSSSSFETNRRHRWDGLLVAGFSNYIRMYLR